jgi:hypothetical protein
MKKIIKLTESELVGVIKRIITEQSEHVKNLYKSWANKKSGNPEKALSIMDDVLKLQKQLQKKDFANYSSYDELVKDLDKIKQAAKSEDVTKIYEDKDLLVLASNTHEASCKYGAGSKWCTTMKDDSSYWKRHNSTGTEFFWIFKNKPQNDPNHKFSYHVKINGEPDWCNSINTCMSTSRLSEKSYPKQHPKYDEIIQKLKEFHDAREMKNPMQNIDQIGNWVENNMNEIVNKITSFYSLLKPYIDDVIYEFLDTEIDNIIPFSLELDDEEGIQEFMSSLEDEITEHFNPNLNGILDYGDFMNSLSWLINSVIGDPIEYLSTHTPEELIDGLYQTHRDNFMEILYEATSIGVREEVSDFASNFAARYQP